MENKQKIDNGLDDILLRSLIGMSRDEFKRKAGLMRNPERNHCPVCKKPIHANDQGDLFCENLNLNYENEGGCFWHRYEDGTNYWSSPEEIFAQAKKKYPELKDL